MTNTHIDTENEQTSTSNPELESDPNHSELDSTDLAELEVDSNSDDDKNSNAEAHNTDKNRTEDNAAEYDHADDGQDIHSNSSNNIVEPAPPEMKKTDIVIAGITYQIYCPIDGEEELRSAVYSINNFVLDIKKQSPKLSQENLLLLCCLNLSEQLHSQQATEDSRRQDHEQSMALLQKIVKDAQSIG